MGKARVVESCMICAPEPCSCFDKPKKVRTPKSPPTGQGTPDAAPSREPEPSSVGNGPARSEAARAAMKAAAAKVQQDRFQRRFAPVQLRPAHGRVEELQLNNALRALAPIMHPDEADKYKMIVGSTPSVQDRATVWRAEHGRY